MDILILWNKGSEFFPVAPFYLALIDSFVHLADLIFRLYSTTQMFTMHTHLLL